MPQLSVTLELHLPLCNPSALIIILLELVLLAQETTATTVSEICISVFILKCLSLILFPLMKVKSYFK